MEVKTNMDNLAPDTITVDQLRARLEETERQIALILEKLHKETGVTGVRIEAEPIYINGSGLFGPLFQGYSVRVFSQMARL